MNGRTPGSVVTLVTPEPPYWSTQSHRCSQSKLTETTIQWQVVHATTRCAQITPEITPTSGITPLHDQPQTQENPVRDCVSKNGAKEIRTSDPLHAMQLVRSSESPYGNRKKPSIKGVFCVIIFHAATAS